MKSLMWTILNHKKRATMTNHNRFLTFAQELGRPWVMLLVILLISILITKIDLPLSEWIYQLHLQQSMPWLIPLTNLGLGIVYMGLLAVIALCFQFIFHQPRYARRTWFLWWSATIPSLVCVVLKISLGRARPDLWFSSHLYGFYGFHSSALYWSFPSGHTSTIMGLMFGLSVLFPRYCLLFIVAGLCIAFSRLLLTQHYLSDVLFATYLACVLIGRISSFPYLKWLYADKRGIGKDKGCWSEGNHDETQIH